MANVGPNPLGAPVVITPGAGGIALESARATLVGTHTPPAAVPEVWFVLQTVVSSVGETEDGQIVRVVAEPWLKIAQALLDDPDLACGRAHDGLNRRLINKMPLADAE